MRRCATTLFLLFALIGCAAAQDYKIAFVSARQGIYTMHGDGSGVKQLTDDDLALLTHGAWSPDGRRVLFCALRKTAGDEQIISKYPIQFHFPLYVMDADGANQKRLLEFPVALGARWSPDGTRIVFSSAYEDPKHEHSAVYVLDVDTGKTSRVTPVAATDLSAFATWSPDGTRIAFTCGTPPEPREICTVNADGSGMREVTTRKAISTMAAWSPDGRFIEFFAARRYPSDQDGGVYVVDAHGGVPRRISKL